MEHLSKRYGSQVIFQDLSFQAGTGITYLTAPSGRGKTTLIRILLGLETADSGRIVPEKEKIRWSVVFQENRLFDGLNALENLRFVLGPDLNWKQAMDLFDELGLGNASDGPVRFWSGGMRRRLALARGLLAVSDALILDEPFAGLDQENRVRALACVRRVACEKPVLLTSHENSDKISGEQTIIL